MNPLKILHPALLRMLLFLGGGLAIAYASACLYLLWRQNHFIFFPSANIEVTPAFFQSRYQDVWLPVITASGKTERIHGWWIPASGPETGVLLYLHGNGINIGANAEQANRFQRLGFSVLLIDYRGYGRSEGEFPTEATVYQDAETAWNYLTQKRRIQPQKIFLYGHSLGGAIAINLAAQHPDAAGLMVQSSFTSMAEMAERMGWSRYFPVNLLLTQRFNSLAKVKSLKLPVLFIHGIADNQVPFQMSQSLFNATPEPKQLLLFPGAGHNNLAEVAGSHYLQGIQTFVNQVQTRQRQLAKKS
jgi:hypothetical protein